MTILAEMSKPCFRSSTKLFSEFRCRSVAAAGDSLFFASPKNSKQKKGEPKSGGLLGSESNFSAVRSTAASGRAFGLANLDSDPKNPCSALPHGFWRMSPGANTGSGVFGVRAQIRRAFVKPCGFFAVRSDPKNQIAQAIVRYFWPLAQLVRARVAIELIASVRPEPVPESDSGPPLQNPCEWAEEPKPRRIRARTCLSEASLHETPAGLSTGGCPQRSGGTQTPGSPFLCLLSFGEAKESRSPAAATARHRNSSTNQIFDSTQGFGQPLNEVKK